MIHILLIVIACLLGTILALMFVALVMLWLFLKAMTHTEKSCYEEDIV